MGNCQAKSTFFRLLGEDALEGNVNSLFRFDNSGLIDFLVTKLKQKNFLNYCDSFPLDNFDPQLIINQYTDHTTELYAKVNLSLASDAKTLQSFGEYIKQLRASILSQPLFDNDLLYRGVDMSDLELNELEKLQSFYIPSFTSTSVDCNKAYSKSCMMILKLPYACKYACSITEPLSKFYHEEREVLLSCYSAYRLERIEYVNKKKFITLYLDEHLSALSALDQIEYYDYNDNKIVHDY